VQLTSQSRLSELALQFEELLLYFTSAQLSVGFVSARFKVSMIPTSDDGDLFTAHLATCNCKLRI